MEKGEEDRSTEKRKPRCPKCSNVPRVFAVFVNMGDLIFSKCAKTILKNKENEGGINTTCPSMGTGRALLFK